MSKEDLALRRARQHRPSSVFTKKHVTPGNALARKRMLTRVRVRRLRAKRRRKLKPVLDNIRTYEDLIEAMRSRRSELGLSQLDVDEMAGFQTGYTGKLEIGYKEGGRGIGAMSLSVWLDTLGVRLQLVPK